MSISYTEITRPSVPSYTGLTRPPLPALCWDSTGNLWDESGLTWDMTGYADIDRPVLLNSPVWNDVDEVWNNIDYTWNEYTGSIYTKITKP